MAETDGFKPEGRILLMLRLFMKLLMGDEVWTGLEVMSVCVRYARLVGAKVTAGTIPVPASDTDCGLPGASSVMVTVAVRAPAAAGVKLMLIVQLAPRATEPAPVRQALPAAVAKAPRVEHASAMLVMLRVAVPLLFRFSV